MASATAEQNKRLQDTLKCGVCQDTLDNPKLLPCYHSFCLKCVEGLVRVRNLKCPECREKWKVPTDGPSALPADFKSNTLKDILALNPQRTTAMCEHHPDNPLELFCKEDNHAICLTCVENNHVGHSFLRIEAAVKEFEKEWDKSKGEWLKSLSDNITKAEKDKFDLKNENIRLTEELEQDRIRVIDTINNQFSSLKRNVDEYYEEKNNARLGLQEEMQTSKAMIETFTTHLGTMQDKVEKIKLFVGLKEQGLFIPEHLPVEPYQFKPCEILHNRIIFGSLYHQSRFDENMMAMSMLHHPRSMLHQDTLSQEDSESIQMSIEDEVEAMSISSGHSKIQLQPEVPLPIKAPRYLSKPVVRKTKKLPGRLMLDIAEVDKSTKVVVRHDRTDFYNNLELINQIKKSMGRIAITPDNCLALTNRTGVISIYSKEGTHQRDIETPFTKLLGIACNDNGELVVYDMDTKTVSHINYTTGTVVTTTSSGLFDSPLYIAVNLSNDVVVSDYSRHCITVIDRDGNKTMEYGTEGSDDGQLRSPTGVCTDGDNIIVADAGNDRVSLICSTGHLIKHLLTREDGLEFPTCVAVDHKGHLLVGEFNGQLIEVQYKE